MLHLTWPHWHSRPRTWPWCINRTFSLPRFGQALAAMSPTAPTQQREGLGLCSEVIDQLLQSVDCTQHLKDSLGQFLSNITADANHKHLAYHLFCTV